MTLKLLILSWLALLIAACATATPFTTVGGQQDNALVEGDSGFFSAVPTPGSYAFLEAINGKKIAGSASKALIPPGTYTFKVACQIDFGPLVLGGGDVTFAAKVGRVYKFAADPTTQEVTGHGFLTKIFGSQVNTCKPFAYDATDGKGPYPESVHLVPAYAPSNWVGHGKAYAGHSIADWLPKGQSESDWTQMVEIEYWSSVMFPETVDQLFQARIDSADKQCPGIQLTVLSKTYEDIYFELEDASCTGNPVRFQLSRFMTGQYGVYEVSYLSTGTITDSEKAAWLQALHNTTTVIQH